MLYSKNAQISPCKSQNKYEGEDTKERKKEEEEERRRRWNTVYPLSCNSTSPRCCQKELTAPPLLTESERYRSGIHGLVVVVVSAALWQFNIIVVFDVVVVVLFNFFFIRTRTPRRIELRLWQAQFIVTRSVRADIKPQSYVSPESPSDSEDNEVLFHRRTLLTEVHFNAKYSRRSPKD